MTCSPSTPEASSSAGRRPSSTFQLARTLAAGLGPRRRGGRQPARPRRQRPAVGHRRRGRRRRRCAGPTFDPATGELAPDAVESVVSERTRLVAVTAASNLIGTRPDLPAIADGRPRPSAPCSGSTACTRTAHVLTDVPASGADFWVCSPTSSSARTTGCSPPARTLLETLHPAKLLPSSDAVPERFELGTLPYELLAGTTAAVDFLAGLAAPTGRTRGVTGSPLVCRAGGARGRAARRAGGRGCERSPASRHTACAKRRTPTLLVTVDGSRPQAIRAASAEAGVNAPARQLLRVGVQPPPRSRRRGRSAHGARALYRPADIERLARGLEEICGST